MTDLLTRLTVALADRYRLERELGQGGMATVYLAQDLRHDRQVAIKVLHEDLGATLGPERFLAEIKTTARLQHPHILPLLDSGSAAGLLFYVMPFVAGESLRDRLEREKQLPLDDALRIAREIADALAHAHGLGVVHRDIKPENILLQGEHALVADFGIALAVQSAGGARLTQTGLSLGTPQYMSPEQALGERSVDHRADIYALGAVTYEMLTGEPPFTGATVQAIVAKVLNERPVPIAILRDTVPGHVNDTVLKALAKLPADRWADAQRFRAALIAGGATRDAPVGASRWSGRHALLAALLGVAAVGAWYWLIGRPEPSRPRTLAVLPMVHADTALEYLALGISDGVRARLVASGDDLRVTSGSITNALRSTPASPRELGVLLDVAYLVVGELRRTPDRVFVRAELVTAADGVVRWNQNFERPAEDLASLADTIATEILASLGGPGTVNPGQLADGLGGTANSEAYDLALRADFLLGQRGAERIQQAAGLFQRAIDLDPQYARAHVGLAQAWMLLVDYSDVPADSVFSLALAAANRAIELAPELGLGHATRGQVWLLRYQWADALADHRIGAALAPDYGMGLKWYAQTLFYTGRFAEAGEIFAQAVRSDSLSAVVWYNQAEFLHSYGDLVQSEVAYRRSLALDPEFPFGVYGLADLLHATGRGQEAAGLLRSRNPGTSAFFRATRARIWAALGVPDSARLLITELGPPAPQTGPAALARAIAFLAVGETDSAMAWLVDAARRNAWVSPVMPWMGPIRQHPRYPELLRIIGLQDQPVATWQTVPARP